MLCTQVHICFLITITNLVYKGWLLSGSLAGFAHVLAFNLSCGSDKMVARWQTTWSHSSMKIVVFWIKSLIFVLRIQLTRTIIGSDNVLPSVRREAIIWANNVQFTDTWIHRSKLELTWPVTATDFQYLLLMWARLTCLEWFSTI